MSQIKQFTHPITTIEDVKTFFRFLQNDLSLDFHPDTPMTDYINSNTGEPTFQDDEAQQLQLQLDNCFQLCFIEVADIYQLSLTASGQSFPEELTILRSVNCYLDLQTGDTFNIVDGKIDLDNPHNIIDAAPDNDWLKSLSVPDLTLVNTMTKRLYQFRNAFSQPNIK